MKEHQAPGRFPRWSRWAFSLALTLLGLALIRAGWRQVAVPDLPVAGRDLPVAASSRGLIAAGRPWSSLQAQDPGAHLAVGGPVSEAGQLIAFDTITAGATIEPPTPTAIPPTPEPTAIPPRTEVIQYKVQPGDNVWLISQFFNISQETVIWANDMLEMDPELLSIGQELNILPVSGVWHTVKAGETLASIARRYQVTPDKITGYAPNGIREGDSLTSGQKLIVPDGIKPFEAHLVRTDAGTVTVNALPEPGRFGWPCNGVITQYFGKWHLALDIANKEGTPIYAADSGTVTMAGWYGTMGNSVRIVHANRYETLYGHMRTLLVKEGDHVTRGQQIGEMGSTGKSTGPHVHFILLYYGGAVNPVRYLPRQ